MSILAWVVLAAGAPLAAVGVDVVTALEVAADPGDNVHIAGDGSAIVPPESTYQDGTVGTARFMNPGGIAAAPNGSALYVTDTGLCPSSNCNTVRKIDIVAGTVSTLVSLPATPHYVTIGPDGYLYVTTGSTGVPEQEQGQPPVPEDGPDDMYRVNTTSGNATVYATGFYSPRGIDFDRDEAMWVADSFPRALNGIPRLSSVEGGVRTTRFDQGTETWFSGGKSLTVAGERIVFGTGHTSNRVNVWAPEGGTDGDLERLDWQSNDGLGLAASADGSRLYSITSNVILEYDLTADPRPAGSGYTNSWSDASPLWLNASTLALDEQGNVYYVLDVGAAAGRSQIWMLSEVAPSLGDAVTPEQVARCRSAHAPSLKDTQAESGDPVKTQWGALYLPATDLVMPGRGGGFDFRRCYSSVFANDDGPLGYGWSWEWGSELRFDDPVPGQVTLLDPSGSEFVFEEEGDGSFTAAPRVTSVLSEELDGSYTLSDRYGGITTYDSSGRMLSVADRHGLTTTLSYTGDEVTSITEPSGRVLTLSWSDGRIASITDPESRTVEYDYSPAGDLEYVTDLEGHRWHYVYDDHLLTDIFDPNQDGAVDPKSTHSTYVDGRVVSQVDPLGNEITFDYEYGSVPGQTLVTDPSGRQRLDVYERGVLVATTVGYGSAEAATWRFQYDPSTLGRTFVIDPNDEIVSRTTYDERGRVLSTVDQAGRRSTFTYTSEFGLPDTVTVGAQSSCPIVTDLQYDAAGQRLVAVETPLKDTSTCSQSGVQRTEYRYEDGSHPTDVTSMIDPDGHEWLFGYTGYGLRNAFIDPAGNRSETTFDLVGRIESSTAPKGVATPAVPDDYVTTYVTDEFGRVTAAVDPLGHGASRTFDPAGNLASSIDANGNVTDYVYDGANQLRFVNRADSSTLENQYWPDGALKAQIDGAGAATVYDYDSAGRLVSITDPNNRITEYGYDPLSGRLVWKQNVGGDCDSMPGTGCIRYLYDGVGDLSAIDYSDPNTPDVTDITWDAYGRRVSQHDGTGPNPATWSWDSLGRMTASSDASGQGVAYGYNLRSLLTSITYPGNNMVARDYDAAGRFYSTTDWLGNQTTFDYDANSNLDLTTFQNGETDDWFYDQADRLVDSWHLPGVFAIVNYGRDNAGQLSSLHAQGTLSTLSGDYGYDELNRLTDVNDGYPRTYEYDDADNLSKLLDNQNLVHDPANQLCIQNIQGQPIPPSCQQPNYASQIYENDDQGNRTAFDSVAYWGLPKAYTYDQANRLATARVPNPDTLADASTYVALTPTRIANQVQFTGGQPQQVQVAAVAGVPNVASGVKAVAIDVTAQQPAGEAPVTIWSTDETQPEVSHLTGQPSKAVTNLVFAEPGAYGTVWISSPVNVKLTIDVVGYFNQTYQSGEYNPVEPTRVFPATAVSKGATTAIQMTGLAGVPADAKSVAVNLQVIDPNKTGKLTTWATGTAKPTAWSASFNPGLSYANLAIVKVGTNGQINLHSTADATLAVDVVGWFGDANGEGSAYLPADPTRLADTSVGTGTCDPAPCAPLAAGTEIDVRITGPDTPHPQELTAVALQVTALEPASNGSLTVWATGGPQPGVANVSLNAGRTVTDTVIVPVGPTGEITIRAEGTATDVAVDLAGWYLPSLVTFTYSYDGDGTRTKKERPGATTSYTWSKAEAMPMLLTETTANLTTHYIYGPGGLPVSQINPDGSVWNYHHDQLGTTIALTDNATMAIVATPTYDPYGKPTYQGLYGDNTRHVPFGYAGQYHDNETGFQYLRARYYDPATGSFITRDPALAMTGQPYAYGNNSPLNHTDPLGLWGIRIGPVKIGNDGCVLGTNPDGSCRGSDATNVVHAVNTASSYVAAGAGVCVVAGAASIVGAGVAAACGTVGGVAVSVNAGTGLALAFTGNKSAESFAVDSAFNAVGGLGTAGMRTGRAIQVANPSRGLLGWPTAKEFGGTLLEGLGASGLGLSSALSALYTALGSSEPC